MNYYNYKQLPDNAHILHYGELPNNSHPMIKHEEHGVFGINANGRQHAATYEVSSGKMFYAKDSTELHGGGKEIHDVDEIDIKPLREKFKNQLPYIKSYRDALISHANGKNFKENSESKKSVNVAYRQIFQDN
jgi:hypothetical protein